MVLVAQIERSTQRLLETVKTLDGAGLAAPSLCEGWTRGHVLSHLSRNADGYTNLFTWVRTGVETPMYASREARNADIDAGAFRTLEEQTDDLRATHARMMAAIDAIPPTAWTNEVTLISGAVLPAHRIVWMRVCEVEIHHVDLDAGYGPADWPAGFARRLLHEEPVPDGIIGPDHAIAAWIIGRSDGADLTVEGGGPLPAVPKWS